jgi:hypothetical protein
MGSAAVHYVNPPLTLIGMMAVLPLLTFFL